MATDYYDDSTESEAPDQETKADEGDATALLPLSFFPEKPEPGKVCSVKVDKVYDDQVSVTYVKNEKPEMEEEEDEEESEMETPSGMDAMMA